MKAYIVFLSILLAAAMLTGCSSLIEFAQKAGDIETIKPSGVIITETREVSGFTAIDMQALGKVTITQGDSESLTVEGSDNIVTLVKTTVKDNTLVIKIEENINFSSINTDDLLTFVITVKDLTDLTVSGLGDIQMDALTTTALKLTMSGAGQLDFQNVTADSLDVVVSGLGSVEIAGKVPQATFEIPGAGEVKAADLECQTANVNISGLGDATLWVTDQLTGAISGGGSVSYYGDPQVTTQTTGLGNFKALGSK